MTKLEMLPAWAGRISDPPVKTTNGHHPVPADEAPEAPLAEWVVNRQPIEPQPVVPEAVVPEPVAPEPVEAQPAETRPPVVVDPGPGALRRLLRALLVVVVMALIIGAGVGAGYLYTSFGG